jgi:5'-nucleotidase
MKRRKFIKQATAAGLILSGLPLSSFGRVIDDHVRLTILHTNDVHSRMDPFPIGSGRLEGKGGVAARAALINEIRKTEPHVLLLDSGDMLQGTPYFNLYKGVVEFKAMNAMGYDVATIGNHDFDAGIDQLATNAKMADFELVSANYRFDDTPMNDLVKDYTIKTIDGIRIGIFGIGIELEGLVPKAWYGNTLHLDPITIGNQTARHLKKAEKCDFVICLSHLGYSYQEIRISDVVFSQATQNIDLILGGHTHTFLDVPDVRRNLVGQPVIISQVGWAGVKLGRLDIRFERGKNRHDLQCHHSWVQDLGKSEE